MSPRPVLKENEHYLRNIRGYDDETKCKTRIVRRRQMIVDENTRRTSVDPLFVSEESLIKTKLTEMTRRLFCCTRRRVIWVHDDVHILIHIHESSLQSLCCSLHPHYCNERTPFPSHFQQEGKKMTESFSPNAKRAFFFFRKHFVSEALQ